MRVSTSQDAGFSGGLPLSLELQNVENGPKLKKILHRTDGSEPFIPHDGNRYFDHDARKVLDKYILTEGLWAYLQAYKEKHRKAGNGFGFGIVGPNDVPRTLSARYHKDGSEILIDRGEVNRPRRLTPRECARLMGYPNSYVIPINLSDTQAYQQFGNSVAAPVIEAIAKHMVPQLLKIMKSKD